MKHERYEEADTILFDASEDHGYHWIPSYTHHRDYGHGDILHTGPSLGCCNAGPGDLPIHPYAGGCPA